MRISAIKKPTELHLPTSLQMYLIKELFFMADISTSPRTWVFHRMQLGWQDPTFSPIPYLPLLDLSDTCSPPLALRGPQVWSLGSPLAQLPRCGTTLSLNLVVSHSVQFSSVAQSCPTLCDPMNRRTAGLPVHSLSQLQRRTTSCFESIAHSGSPLSSWFPVWRVFLVLFPWFKDRENCDVLSLVNGQTFLVAGLQPYLFLQGFFWEG